MRIKAMNSMIEIQEFSTGIEIFGTPDNWVTGGFTGNYLNSTLESVPSSVQNAISSQYFAVAEGTSSKKPVVIGREISDWSVLVTVIKGIDNMGRSAPLYRYFLCQGIGNIRHILHWMITEKGKILPFDPFDQQIVGRPHQYHITYSNPIHLRPELENLLSQNSFPIIVPSHEPCPPLILNQMAHCLGSPISWAYQVQAVAKPTSFQIIQPIDSNSEAVIKRAIATTPKQPQIVMEEQQITTAIRGLISRENFKPEHLLTIENNLDRPQVDHKYWLHLFDQQGAKDALKNKTYAPQMIRLLTLKVMVLPETLPEFLSWIQQSNNQKQHYQISTSFQNQIIQYLQQNLIPKLKSKLGAGVIPMIPNLIHQPNLLDSTVWLLAEDKGVWGYLYKKQVINNLHHDFVLIENNKLNIETASQQGFKILHHPAWQPISRDLGQYLRLDKTYKLTQYQPIADFFSKIGKLKKSYLHYRLFALFIFISQGEIPKKLYLILKENGSKITRDGLKVKVYGFPLKREITLSEKFWQDTKDFMLFLWRRKIKIEIPLLIPFIASIILVLILGANFSSKILSNIFSGSTEEIIQQNDDSSDEQEQDLNTPQTSAVVTSNSTQDPNAPINPEQLELAITQFETTRKVIKTEVYQSLYQEFIAINNQNSKAVEAKIISSIKNVLDPEKKFNLQYGSIINQEKLVIDNNPQIEQWIKNWIETIYFYQQKNQQQKPSINVVGYLVPKGETNNLLIEDIRKNINFQINPAQNTPPGGQ